MSYEIIQFYLSPDRGAVPAGYIIDREKTQSAVFFSVSKPTNFDFIATNSKQAEINDWLAILWLMIILQIHAAI